MIRFLLLFFWSASACAAGLSVDLQRVSLPDFLRVVYGELLKKSYVLDASVVADHEPFSLVLRDMSEADIEREAGRLLVVRGYRIDADGGVSIVRKGGDLSGEEIIVYRPAHRSVSYLMTLVESLFRPGAFVSRRGVNGTLNQISGTSMIGSSPGSVSSQGDHYASGLNSQLGAEQDVIVFRGSDVEIKRFRTLVAQVDVPVAELLVKAVVLEVQTTQTTGSAVDLVASILKTKVGLNLTGGADASNIGHAFVKFSAGGIDLSAVYAAVSGDTRFRVLTSPRLRVRSGGSARFSVGNETPILGSVSYDANGRPVQNVTYKPSGVIFELRPNIRAESAELSVMQQLSQFAKTTNGVNNSPTLIKREIKTEVVAADGDLVLLGGLDEEKDTGGASGLSFLPSFLWSSSEEKSKTEIVLMIQAERI